MDPEDEKEAEEIELDESKLERRVVATIGDVPCRGPPYKGSGVLSKARDTPIVMLGEPVYPLKIVYDDGEVEISCPYLWEKYCIVSSDKDKNTLCVYYSSRKIHRQAIR